MNKRSKIASTTGTDVLAPADTLPATIANGETESADGEAESTLMAGAATNIGLTIAGGLALGLVAGALWPRRKPAKVAKTKSAIADMLGEVRELIAVQAAGRAASLVSDSRDKLDSVSRDAGKTINDSSARLRKQAHRLADEASDRLHDGGKAIARTAVKLVEKARR